MKNKVYYGEYSLSHWIDLILSKNIVLPEYQRLFVWDKTQVTNFLKSIKEGNYVPPITIGHFKEGGKTVNYILDGQQRLTSIILALFDLFPKKGKEAVKAFQAMNENDDEVSEDDLKSVLEWRFDKLTELGDSYESITRNIDRALYDAFDAQYTSGDYKNHFLGFSYIVPKVDNEKQQQNFYATVFRNINFRGSALSSLESREALYFLDNSLTGFFKADIGDYFVTFPTVKIPLDFVRYIALLSQYHKFDPKTTESLAAGYGSKKRIEDYYESYIYSVVSGESDSFYSFEELFPNREYAAKIIKLKHNLDALSYPKEYASIIDIDTYMFGVIYYVLFMDKEIDADRKDEIVAELEAEITLFKTTNHKKSPAALKYLRERICKSIEIYAKYAI